MKIQDKIKIRTSCHWICPASSIPLVWPNILYLQEGKTKHKTELSTSKPSTSVHLYMMYHCCCWLCKQLFHLSIWCMEFVVCFHAFPAPLLTPLFSSVMNCTWRTPGWLLWSHFCWSHNLYSCLCSMFCYIHPKAVGSGRSWRDKIGTKWWWGCSR